MSTGGQMPSNTPMWKTSRTATKKAKLKLKADRIRKVNASKGEVRKRDRGCRFPMCGCRKLGLLVKARPEVSHDKHQGMGGNPAGDRSAAAIMVQLCNHRHQDGRVSRHSGTMRAVPLTAAGYDGPVAWYVEVDTLCNAFPYLGKMALLIRSWPGDWRGVCVATEKAPGQLEALADWQRDVLMGLAQMDW